MLFHTFSSQEERREYGGSCFIEMQYCRLPRGTEIEKIISVDAIRHWKNDSLYIYGDDDNEFVAQYKKIFTDGIYNNLKRGMVDMYGINYYSREQTRLILEKLKEIKPSDWQVLLSWLERAETHNGFYILGL